MESRLQISDPLGIFFYHIAEIYFRESGIWEFSKNELNVGKVVNATADFAKHIFRKLGS